MKKLDFKTKAKNSYSLSDQYNRSIQPRHISDYLPVRVSTEHQFQ